MKLWVDDLRLPPNGYRWCKSVNETIKTIENYELMFEKSGNKSIYQIEMIDLDHDAGDYANDGGDFIRILDWLEATNRNYPIRIHTMNPVGRNNMMNIISKNNWKLIY